MTGARLIKFVLGLGKREGLIDWVSIRIKVYVRVWIRDMATIRVRISVGVESRSRLGSR